MAKEIIEAEIKSNIGEFSKHLDGAAEGAKKLGKETENVGGASKKAVGGVKKLTVGFKALAVVATFLNPAFTEFKDTPINAMFPAAFSASLDTCPISDLTSKCIVSLFAILKIYVCS